MNKTALSLVNVTRTYHQGGRDLTVLNQLNLDIAPGEVVALIGPSGSGKTTLLQIAGLLDTPDAGNVIIAGESMNGVSEARRTMARSRHIGFVYQFHHLLPEFSAIENVMLPQIIAEVPAAVAKQKAANLLSELGLADRLHHRPAALSGGEQQRVAIARALANEPALVLADEPTGNLDAATAEIVFGLLMRIVREKQVAMLVATHNPELAQRMDRIIKVS